MRTPGSVCAFIAVAATAISVQEHAYSLAVYFGLVAIGTFADEICKAIRGKQ